MILAGVSPAQTFSALRHPHYRRFWWGGLVSLVGTWMKVTALSWLVYDLTGSPLMLGTVTFVNTLPTMALSLVGGAVADRSEKRYLLVATQGTFMVVAAALAALTLTGRIQVWHILALSTVTGIAAAIDMPARQSLIPHLVVRDDLMNAIALNSAVFNGARIFGPAIAGLVIDQAGGRTGAGWSFAVNACTYLAVLVALLTIPVNSRPSGGVRQHVLKEVRDGLAFAWHHPAVRTLIILLAVAGTFGFSYTVLMPVFARDVLGVPADGYGMLLTANGIGATVGALALASIRPARPGMVILGTLAGFVVMLALFASTPVYGFSLALMVGVGGAMTAYLAATNTTIQSIVPDELRGRVMSIYILAFFGTAPLGGLLMGFLASAAGAQTAVLIGAAACGLAVVAARPGGRAIVRPAPPVESLP